MAAEYPIVVDNITKHFRVYLDKGRTLKELALFSKRRKFEDRKVIDGISFKVAKGEAVALIGHNGCGKSTTLKLLTKIMYPDTGKITMQGRVSSLIELGAGFHPDMSGRENIYINASIFGLTRKEIDRRVDQIIEFSELKDYIDNPVRTYSSGMYMRLAFAVAINVDADILLVDEILAVGDANFQAKCYEKMRDLKANGVTIVLVTHDMSTVKTFCNRAIWINKGKIAAEGKSGDIVDTYLAYMNEQRMEQINESDENEQIAKKLEEMKARKQEEKENEEMAAENGLTMDPTAIHFGNQKAVITKCEIINSKGKAVKALATDEPYSLRFHYKVNKPMEELVFGMGIFTLEGLWIFGTNTQIAGLKVDVSGKTEGVVEFHSSPLHLSGRFILQCSVIEPDTTPCDYYNEYTRFDVMKASREVGFVYYDTDWTVEEGGTA